MKARLPPAVGGLALAILALAAGLAACGGGEDEQLTGCAESPGSKEAPTIVAAEVEDVGEVLALPDCTPLYTNDVDTGRRIRCTGGCARVWVPVTVGKGNSVTTQTPIPISPVTIVERPDGQSQAAVNGKPLYAYSEEGEEGASGDGVTDTFGGAEFTWSAVTLDEAASSAGRQVPLQPGQGPAPVQPGQGQAPGQPGQGQVPQP